MNTKSKIALSVSIVVMLVAIATIAIVVVWAATQQQFTSSINVSYKAASIKGSASARWKVGKEDWKPMTTNGKVDGNTSLNFDSKANEDAALTPTDEFIDLTDENPYVVFEYKFTNASTKEYAIDLFYNDDANPDTNISVTCFNSDTHITSDFLTNINTNFGDWTTTTISANNGAKDGEKYVYVLAQITDIFHSAAYSGSFSFELDGKSYSNAFNFDPATGTINGLTNTSLTTVRIPSKIGETDVTTIAAGAFTDNTTIKEVTIPDSVETIDFGAFNENCSNLKYISIPFVGNTRTASSLPQTLFGYIFGADTVEDTRQQLFYIPESLTNAIIVDSTNIGDEAFSGCYMITNITIPKGVTNIGGDAFYGCSGLKSITIPSSVGSIGLYAFGDCSGLTSITIPNSVTNIASGAFAGCSGLTSIKVNSANTYYTSRSSTGAECNIILSTQGGTKGTLIAGCNNSTIPDDGSVTSIGDNAFSNCSGLTSITIPEGVTSIGGYAFHDCIGLTNISIPSSIKSIGNYAFYSCSGLKEVIIESQTVCSNLATWDASSYSTSLTYNAKTIKARYEISGLSRYTSQGKQGDYYIYTKNA